MPARGKGSQKQQHQSPSSLPDFQEWMQSVGITWDTDLMALVEACPACSGMALGVQAVSDVTEGALLCTIPKTAILSRRTTSIADLLEAEKLGGGLALTIAAAHEAALGPASKWYGYLRSLPAREYLPLLWDEAQLAELQGTDLEGAPEQDSADTADDYESHVVPLMEAHPAVMGGGSHISLDAFRAAASWVASRAFYVDAWHGDALVPLADAFNHKASLVELADGYVVGEEADARQDDSSSDSDSDGRDGSRDDIENDSDDAEEHEGDEQEAGQQQTQQNGHAHMKCTLVGHANCNGHHEAAHAIEQQHSEERRASGAAATSAGNDDVQQQQQQQWQGVGQEGDVRRPIISARAAGTWARHGVNLRLEIGICSVERGDLDVLEIVAASDIKKGNQIHNTYGEHGNTELVKKYGFGLRPNPFDELSVDKQEVLDAAAQVVGERTVRRRCRFLLAHSELLSDEAEPFAVLPHGAINAPLFAALRTLCVPDTEFGAWDDATDALRPAGKAAAAPAVGQLQQQDKHRGSTAQQLDVGEASEGADKEEVRQEEQPLHNAGSGPGSRWEDETRICGDAALWCVPMVGVLTQVLEQRQGRYPAGSSREDDARQLDKLAASTDRSEAASARRAALTLRLGERDMIQAALQALDGCSNGPAAASTGAVRQRASKRAAAAGGAPAEDSAGKQRRRRG